MTRGLLTATVRSVLTAGLVSAIGGIAGVLGAPSTKAAEPDTPKAAAIVQSTPSDSGRGWPIVVSPYVWAASLDGDGSLAGFNTNIDIPFSHIFEKIDVVVMGEVEVAAGRWTGYLDVQHVKTSQDEEVFSRLIGLRSTTTSYAAGVFYRVYDVDLGSMTPLIGRAGSASSPPWAYVGRH